MIADKLSVAIYCGSQGFEFAWPSLQFNDSRKCVYILILYDDIVYLLNNFN